MGVGEVNKEEIEQIEILFLLVKHFGKPLEKLMQILEPVTYGLVQKYYFKDYEADDFLQEARMILFESINEYIPNGKILFYQYYHMKLSNHLNTLVRYHQAQKRRVNLETISLDDLIEDAGLNIQGVAPSNTNPEDVALAKETFDEFISGLSAFEKIVFDQFVEEGKSIDEIANDLPEENREINSALYRCGSKFRKIFD